jgi:hypothetical protein
LDAKSRDFNQKYVKSQIKMRTFKAKNRYSKSFAGVIIRNGGLHGSFIKHTGFPEVIYDYTHIDNNAE